MTFSRVASGAGPVVLLGVLLLGSCRRKPERTGPCSGDLSGTWRGEADAKYRYRIVDEGAKIRLEPLFAIGGPGTSYGKFLTTLVRKQAETPQGATETLYTEKGKSCPVKFASRIEDCSEGAFTLVGETHFDIKLDTCEVSRTGAVSRARLVREGSH